jgi:hypothetical protein
MKTPYKPLSFGNLNAASIVRDRLQKRQWQVAVGRPPADSAMVDDEPAALSGCGWGNSGSGWMVVGLLERGDQCGSNGVKMAVAVAVLSAIW